MSKVQLKNVLAPHYYPVHHAIKDNAYTHFWHKGGRGSTKSSFIAIEIILGMMNNPNTHAIVMRRFAVSLRDSVYEQIKWAIDMLGVSHLWKPAISPMRITYTPTGQTIIFRGSDDPLKLKSLKFANGYPRYIWFEELNEFQDMDTVNNLLQSFMRGGDMFTVFYSYNPPQSMNSWVNQESLTQREDRLIHHSTYNDVPVEWLGKPFILEAEHMFKVNPQKYKHVYEGEATGTGGAVFANVEVRKIREDEIRRFDYIAEGIDFGYASDPFVWIKNHLDTTRRILYLCDEIYKAGYKLRDAAPAIMQRSNAVPIADSEDPRAIDELKDHGLRVEGARKGPNSRDYGFKWLQDLETIIVDPIKCPHAMREFTTYEYEPDKYGGFKTEYPKINDHVLDATRYSREKDMRYKKAKALGGKPQGW